MLPLLASSRPDSSTTLLSQLEAGLTTAFRGSAQIHSAPNTLQIDLESPEFDALPDLPRPASPDRSAAVLELSSVQIRTRNARLWNVPLSLDAHFEDASWVWAPSQAPYSALLLESARSGEIQARIHPEDLEKLVSHSLGKLAASQGFELLETSIQLTPCDPVSAHGTHREVHVQLSVKARAFIMNTALTLSGRAKVTDDLHLSFSELRCDGQGMAVTAARSFLAPTFKKLESQLWPLFQWIPSSIPLRSVELECGDPLAVIARFGKPSVS
jgi:hypothetical protein